MAGCEKMLLGPEQDNTPQNNLNLLWKTLDENYAIFPVKNINWDSIHSVYSAKVNTGTSNTDLWNITCEMLSNLDDGHVHLVNADYSKSYNSSRIALRQPYDFSLDLVKSKYLSFIKIVGAGQIIYGKIKNSNIGYIYISSFGNPVGYGSDWANDIDIAVQELSSSDGLIIDLRNNGGGLVVTLRTIASDFIDREINYFDQRAKTGPGHNDFGPLIHLLVDRSTGRPTFTKKLALLTNRFSGSGSEHFAQIFKSLSYAKQIGDTTFGAFGDIISTAELPNGWTCSFPCRLTTTSEGKCYEGIGIVPNILSENTRFDITAGRDNVINTAVTYLTSK
jgi:C-terminal processing protease CtpA/Prc